MTEKTRATLVLADLLRRVPASNDDNKRFAIEEAWVDGDAICIVYRGWWHRGLLGLRRQIEDGPSVEEIVGYVVAEELGEPPGSLIENAKPDEREITWWKGNDSAWRDYRRYA